MAILGSYHSAFAYRFWISFLLLWILESQKDQLCKHPEIEKQIHLWFLPYEMLVTRIWELFILLLQEEKKWQFSFCSSLDWQGPIRVYSAILSIGIRTQDINILICKHCLFLKLWAILFSWCWHFLIRGYRLDISCLDNWFMLPIEEQNEKCILSLFHPLVLVNRLMSNWVAEFMW